MAQISFSIVVVCLNPGEKLLKTVQSVLNQKYGNYEIVVKDGGSTDGSLEQLPADSRIRVYTRPDSGIYDAMNQAMSYVTGQFVQFLNCGDLLHDDMVLEQLAVVMERKRSRGADGESLGHKEKERIFYQMIYEPLFPNSITYSLNELDKFAKQLNSGEQGESDETVGFFIGKCIANVQFTRHPRTREEKMLFLARIESDIYEISNIFNHQFFGLVV